MTDYNKQIVELIDDFSFFENWEDKYQYLIDLGRNVPKMDEKLKVDKNKLKGCQSVVYFSNSVNNDGSINFIANSDAAIVQGLIALMLKVYSGRKPQEILDIDIYPPSFQKRKSRQLILQFVHYNLSKKTPSYSIT